MKIKLVTALATAMAAFAISANAATIIPITAMSTSHGGDRYANGMPSVTNGSGIDKTADPSDPSTWVFDGSVYGDELMSAGLTSGLNGKTAWQSYDFGTSTALETMYLFNINYSSGIAGINSYKIYYSDSPTVALPAMPNKNNWAITGLTPQGDYDFVNGGGWTLLGGSRTATKAGIDAVDLSGTTARYIALEIFSNHGDTNSGGRVGIDEIAFTTAVPEPSTTALLGLAGLALILRRRK